VSDSPFKSIDEMFERQRKRAEEQQAAREALMRSEGIAATARVSTSDGYGGLIADGPDVRGSVSLFLMQDGTVRWRRPQ
jgi:hypothetical protein